MNLVIRSWLLLLRFDLVMCFGKLGALRKAVAEEVIRGAPAFKAARVETICRSVDLACVFYFKPVMCLQRSAVTSTLLRRFGHQATLTIGAQLIPLRSHAWVESDGRVVNDKPYVTDIYQVLDRF